MDHVKDQSTLARAFVLAVHGSPNARNRMRLIIVGDGALRVECERIVGDAGMRELAWFAGERNDIAQVMRGLDCFVLPSLGEGISNTILEAMACALPVIATRVGGNPELVDEGVTGKTVIAGDPSALSRAILSYFEDGALARRHGIAARSRIERAFSLSHMVESYHQLYSAELRAGRGRVSRAAVNPTSAGN